MLRDQKGNFRANGLMKQCQKCAHSAGYCIDLGFYLAILFGLLSSNRVWPFELNALFRGHSIQSLSIEKRLHKRRR